MSNKKVEEGINELIESLIPEVPDNTIEGSKMWAEEGKVPDEYGIKYLGNFRMRGNRYLYLEFSFVEPLDRLNPQKGFIKSYGTADVDPDVEEVIIAQNSLTTPAAFFIKKGNKITFGGKLFRLEYIGGSKEPEVAQKSYWSEVSKLPKQKCDENAPDWLKELAEKVEANVLYIKL